MTEPTATPQSAFLQEFIAVTQLAADGKRKLGPVFIEMADRPSPSEKPLPGHQVYLSDITAETHRRGHGTQALNRILALADKHGVDVMLDAVPGKNGMSDRGLRDYYRRFGFTRCEPYTMIRTAQPAALTPPAA